jgi:hypothetical protein
MTQTDKDRNQQDGQSASRGQGAPDTKREQASKDADAGVAKEQGDEVPNENEEPKRQDPPVPGQPKKIRVEVP